MGWSRIFRWTIALAVVAIYVAARFWNLTSSCLWFDEIFSVHAAEHSWDSILNFVSLDLIHPPLFYLLLKIWIAIGGESLFWLRALPVLFSIAAVVPFALLCRELRSGYWASVLALFLIAVNGSLIKYAQEVRMYSMLMCCALFSMWLFARYFEKGKGIAALTLVNIVLVYSHYFGWFVVLSEVVALLVFQRIKWRAMFLMIIVTFASFIPWLVAVSVAARSGSDVGQNIGWMQQPGFLSLGQLALGLVEPFYYSATSIDPLSVYRVSVPMLVIAGVSLAIYFANRTTIRNERKTTAYLLLIFTVVPTIIAFLASWLFPYSIWGTRHLIIIFAPAAMLIADAIVHLGNLKLRTFAVTLVVLFVGYAFVIQVRQPLDEPIWCGLEPIANEAESETAAPIVVFEDLMAYHLWFAFRKDGERPALIKVQGVSGMDEDTSYFLPRGFDEITRISPDELNYNQMWAVYRPTITNPTEPAFDTLGSNGYEIVEQKALNFRDQKLIAALVSKKMQ